MDLKKTRKEPIPSGDSLETEGEVSILEISCFEARWLSLTEVRKSGREDTAAAGAAAEGGGGKDVA